MSVFGLGEEISTTQGDVQMDSLLTDRDLEILATKLPDVLRTRPLREWLELLWANEVAALPVGIPGEALDDDQVRYAGIVAGLDDPVLGPIEVVGPCILLSETPGRISRAGAPPRRGRRGGADARMGFGRAAGGATTARHWPARSTVSTSSSSPRSSLRRTATACSPTSAPR